MQRMVDDSIVISDSSMISDSGGSRVVDDDVVGGLSNDSKAVEVSNYYMNWSTYRSHTMSPSMRSTS